MAIQLHSFIHFSPSPTVLYGKLSVPLWSTETAGPSSTGLGISSTGHDSQEAQMQGSWSEEGKPSLSGVTKEPGRRTLPTSNLELSPDGVVSDS